MVVVTVRFSRGHGYLSTSRESASRTRGGNLNRQSSHLCTREYVRADARIFCNDTDLKLLRECFQANFRAVGGENGTYPGLVSFGDSADQQQASVMLEPLLKTRAALYFLGKKHSTVSNIVLFATLRAFHRGFLQYSDLDWQPCFSSRI